MDHSHMDHSQMDHSQMDGHMDHGHMGHGGGSMNDMCSMDMLFTWDTTNLCIVFRQWHIRSNTSLVFSLIAVVLIAMAYEALRAFSRRFEANQNCRLAEMPSRERPAETTPFLVSGQRRARASQRIHLIKAILYALQNFYAFMLMLVFMTYNGWVMVAVTLGAFLGYLVFGQSTPATKDNACH